MNVPAVTVWDPLGPTAVEGGGPAAGDEGFLPLLLAMLKRTPGSGVPPDESPGFPAGTNASDGGFLPLPLAVLKPTPGSGLPPDWSPARAADTGGAAGDVRREPAEKTGEPVDERAVGVSPPADATLTWCSVCTDAPPPALDRAGWTGAVALALRVHDETNPVEPRVPAPSEDRPSVPDRLQAPATGVPERVPATALPPRVLSEPPAAAPPRLPNQAAAVLTQVSGSFDPGHGRVIPSAAVPAEISGAGPGRMAADDRPSLLPPAADAPRGGQPVEVDGWRAARQGPAEPLPVAEEPQPTPQPGRNGGWKPGGPVGAEFRFQPPTGETGTARQRPDRQPAAQQPEGFRDGRQALRLEPPGETGKGAEPAGSPGAYRPAVAEYASRLREGVPPPTDARGAGPEAATPEAVQPVLARTGSGIAPQPATVVAEPTTVSAVPDRQAVKATGQPPAEGLPEALVRQTVQAAGSADRVQAVTAWGRQTPVPVADRLSIEPPSILLRLGAQPDPPALARQLAEAVTFQVQRSQSGTGQSVRVRIALDPPELGRVTMKLTFGREGLEVRFFTPDRAVKAVIEQALPQLRDVLARQEISLGDTTVFLGQEGAHEQRLFREPWTGGSVPDDPVPETVEGRNQTQNGVSDGLDCLV